MKDYKPQYPNQSHLSDGMTTLGKTSRELIGLEEEVQKKVAENPEWLIARNLRIPGAMECIGEKIYDDSKPELEAMGFKVVGESDDLFYRVIQPEGWEKVTNGYHTSIRDNTGTEKIYQFFKGASHERKAYLDINQDNE
ncbi:MAG: hypothetical protein ABIH28_03520 [archaeon]